MDLQKIQWEEGVSPLKFIRKRLGMTQTQFGHELGTDKDTISRWERGTHTATFTIKQIKAFDSLLKSIDLNWADLPDSLEPYQPKSA